MRTTPCAAAVALVALAALTAPAAGEESLRGVLKAGYEALDAWDTRGAHQAAEALAARAPDEAAVRELTARVRFEEGDYAAAVAIVDGLGAHADRDFAALARATLKETKSYVSRESDHFVLAYRDGKDAVLAPYALETLEKQRAALAHELRYAPPGKTRVEVLEDAKALARVSPLTLDAIKTSGTIALCKYDKLMITSPKALVRGYEWQDTLAHEYTHLVVSKMSRNTVPIWLHEGLAKFLESSWRGAPGLGLSPASAGLLAEALKKSKLIPFERMHPSMALLPSQEDAALAFAEVFTAIEYLYGRGGSALLVKIVDRLKAGESYDAAVGKALGSTFGRFQSEWMAYLAKRDFPRETLPLSAEKLKFREDTPGKQVPKDKEKGNEELRFGDFLEIQDPAARKLAHLGELLRERNRTAGAIEEFGKAYARVGNRSPALSNRYAQALLKVGDLARAEQILVASLKPYPSVARTHQNLADIYLATQRWSDGERSLLEVIGIDPFDPLPHAGLLKIYSMRKDDARLLREQTALEILAGKKQPPPSTGVLSVRSHPFARVFLDNVDTGQTTPARLQVPPGSHIVKLVNEERGFSREESVEVDAGQEKTVEVAFDGAAPPPVP